jgi:hypothetical protein
MSKFQDQIKHTLTLVAPQNAQAGGNMAPFDQVLREFAETLAAEQPSLGAAIEQGHHPRMRMLVTWPRTRRDERTIMLTFWWDGTTMKALDEKGTPTFDSPDAVGDYLLAFLTTSAFPATLAEYKARCDEDVYGYLRKAASAEASPSDVTVLVSASEQRKLAEAKLGEMITLEVEPQLGPHETPYQHSTGYACLVSGGYILNLIDHHPKAEGAKLGLLGEVTLPSAAE